MECFWKQSLVSGRAYSHSDWYWRWYLRLLRVGRISITGLDLLQGAIVSNPRIHLFPPTFHLFCLMLSSMYNHMFIDSLSPSSLYHCFMLPLHWIMHPLLPCMSLPSLFFLNPILAMFYPYPIYSFCFSSHSQVWGRTRSISLCSRAAHSTHRILLNPPLLPCSLYYLYSIVYPYYMFWWFKRMEGEDDIRASSTLPEPSQLCEKLCPLLINIQDCVKRYPNVTGTGTKLESRQISFRHNLFPTFCTPHLGTNIIFPFELVPWPSQDGSFNCWALEHCLWSSNAWYCPILPDHLPREPEVLSIDNFCCL